MKPITLLMILLANQGYWQSGQENTIELRWATPANAPEAELVWELTHGPASIGGGRIALRPAGEPTRLAITAPEVCVRTTLRWNWRLVERGGRELESGSAPIHLFPPGILEPLPARIGQQSLVIVGQADDLARALQRAKASFTALDAPSALQMRRADVILVGADQLGQRPLDQGPLLTQARNGASVMIFAQGRPARLAEYSLVERTMPPQLAWRTQHPLLADLDEVDLQSLLRGQAAARFIQLPADEAALEIAWRPLEAPGRQPAPIDALLVTKSIGAGRIILCQLPLGPFDTDPRSQLLLRNAIEYLLSRPEPTPPPSQRRIEAPAAAPVPTIQIPSGG